MSASPRFPVDPPSAAITNPNGDVVVTLLTKAMSVVQETVAKTPAEQQVFRIRLDTKTSAYTSR